MAVRPGKTLRDLVAQAVNDHLAANAPYPNYHALAAAPSPFPGFHVPQQVPLPGYQVPPLDQVAGLRQLVAHNLGQYQDSPYGGSFGPPPSPPPGFNMRPMGLRPPGFGFTQPNPVDIPVGMRPDLGSAPQPVDPILGPRLT